MVRMRRFLFSGLLVLLLASLVLGAQEPSPSFPKAAPESQGLSSNALAELKEIVQGYTEGDQIVGAELLVIKNRFAVLHEVFGMRDREEKVPWERHTPCNIRSMTKPITGAGIQLLVEEGKLKLTDRVSEYIPGFKNEKCKEITIEQLLSHRGGLPLTVMATAESLNLYKDLLSMANAIGEKKTEFDPGSKFWYSDAGTDVLGAVSEVLSKMPLGEFRKKRLLDPLGMKDTFTVTKKSPFPKERAASLYTGTMNTWKRFWKPSDEPFYPFAWGSQTLYSTPMDYAKFLAMWMDGGMAREQRVLSKESVARMLTPVCPMTSLGTDVPFPTGFPGHKVYYGQMAMLYMDPKGGESKKPAVIGHSGSDGTFAWAWPDLDLMILYYTQCRGQDTGVRLEKDIYRLLVNPGFNEALLAIPDKYKPYMGQYTANFGPYKNVKFKILMQNESLALDIPGRMIFELNEPNEKGQWTFKLANTVSVSFSKEDTGKVKEMTLVEITDLPRKSGPEGVAEGVPEESRPFLGKYTIPLANVEITVLFQNDSLAVDIPTQGIQKLNKTAGKRRWTFEKDENAEVFFDFDDSGNVTAMNISNTFVLPRED